MSLLASAFFFFFEKSWNPRSTNILNKTLGEGLYYELNNWKNVGHQSFRNLEYKNACKK